MLSSLISEPIIGLDMGGTKMLGVLMSGSAEILTRVQSPTPRGNEAVQRSVISLLESLIQSARDLNLEPCAIAVGAPGFIDTQRGMIVEAENLQVKNLPLTQVIQDHFIAPTRLFHDVRSAVLGEALFGRGVGRRNFAFLNIGTGVAVGLFLDGKVYHGATNKAGEIGHICLNPGGAGKGQPLENRLEALVSGPALVRRAAAALEQFSGSLILELADQDPGRVTAQIVHKAAQAGDRLAVQLIAETADYLGVALAAIMDILDLECVILGGGVTQMGAHLLEPVITSAARYAIEPVPIFISSLGGDAGVVGAIASYLSYGG